MYVDYIEFFSKKGLWTGEMTPIVAKRFDTVYHQLSVDELVSLWGAVSHLSSVYQLDSKGAIE